LLKKVKENIFWGISSVKNWTKILPKKLKEKFSLGFLVQKLEGNFFLKKLKESIFFGIFSAKQIRSKFCLKNKKKKFLLDF
jgi:hypothetical protein